VTQFEAYPSGTLTSFMTFKKSNFCSLDIVKQAEGKNVLFCYVVIGCSLGINFIFRRSICAS
jgi:hypothetical protein